MELKVGDTIKFLNEVGGGKITKIIDKEMVRVETPDGFEFPISKKEVFKVDLEQDFFFTDNVETQKIEKKKNTKNQKIEEDEEDEIIFQEIPFQKETDEINIYFAFVPKNQKDKTNCDLDIYLINDSNYHCFYNYQKKLGNQFESRPNKIEANTKELIETTVRDGVVNYEHLEFQFIFFKTTLHDFKPSFSKQIKLNITKLFREGTFTENDFFEEHAFILTIFEENMMQKAMENIENKDIEKIIKQKEQQSKRINEPKQFAKNITNMQVEIDLHIHELIDDHSDLKPTEILEIQMNNFQRELGDAIRNPKVEKAIFIHGLGNGTLKNEIIRELDRNYKKFKYQDASFKEYGYGATLVYVK